MVRLCSAQQRYTGRNISYNLDYRQILVREAVNRVSHGMVCQGKENLITVVLACPFVDDSYNLNTLKFLKRMLNSKIKTFLIWSVSTM